MAFQTLEGLEVATLVGLGPMLYVLKKTDMLYFMQTKNWGCRFLHLTLFNLMLINMGLQSTRHQETSESFFVRPNLPEVKVVSAE